MKSLNIISRGATIAVLVALAGPAFADRVIVKEGPVLEGVVEDKGDFIHVKTAKGVIVRVPRGSVARIESDEAPERLREIKTLIDGAARHPRKKDGLGASLAKFHDAFVVPALLDRLERASSSEERRLAARELGTRKADGVLRALSRAVVLDAAAPVRSQAMDSLRRIGDPETGALFVQALSRSEPAERTRATAALGTFPRKEAVAALANLANPGATSADNNSSRAHIFVGTERAFIGGYELSSGGTGLAVSEVAKPIVNVLRDGVVLDVSARYIIEYETFVRGSVLRFLSGQNHQSVKDWQDWWQREGSTFELSPEARKQLESLGR